MGGCSPEGTTYTAVNIIQCVLNRGGNRHMLIMFMKYKLQWGDGCSSVGRAGRLVIVRSPAPGRAELHVQVSLSEILIPTLLISEGPAMSWRLVQGVPCPRPEQQHPVTPWKEISGYG